MIKALAKNILPRSLWTQLRVLRIQSGIQSYPRKTVSHMFGDHQLQVLLADPQGAGWYDHDWKALPELELLKQGKLRRGARVFDMGAHQCVVALLLAKIVGEDGFVVAVEPNAHNVSVGKENSRLNRAEKQIHVLQAAVAESSGTVTVSKSLNCQVDDNSHEWGSMQVPSFSIDDLGREYGTPDVLFLDVEGYECRALSGAVETLKSGPDCFVEVHVGAGLEKFGSVSALMSFFPSSQYSLFVRTEGQDNFTELPASGDLPRERFFLVALHK